MANTVAIVGGGRVGRTLGHALGRAGWKIGPVVTRSGASARAAVRAIGQGRAYSRIVRALLGADIFILAVPDGALRVAAEELARVGGMEWRGKIVLHTSGALDPGVLAPLARCGAATGSMHPLQTFGRRRRPSLPGSVFAITGSRRALQVSRQLARSLGGLPVPLRASAKPAYHAAAVLVAGHSLALMEAATVILTGLGFTRRQAKMALLPLMRETLANFERGGGREAWTGPVARGDFSTVARHRRALAKWPAEILKSYAALARLSARLLGGHPKRTLRQLDRVLPKQ